MFIKKLAFDGNPKANLILRRRIGWKRVSNRFVHVFIVIEGLVIPLLELTEPEVVAAVAKAYLSRVRSGEGVKCDLDCGNKSPFMSCNESLCNKLICSNCVKRLSQSTGESSGALDCPFCRTPLFGSLERIHSELQDRLASRPCPSCTSQAGTVTPIMEGTRGMLDEMIIEVDASNTLHANIPVARMSDMRLAATELDVGADGKNEWSPRASNVFNLFSAHDAPLSVTYRAFCADGKQRVAIWILVPDGETFSPRRLPKDTVIEAQCTDAVTGRKLPKEKNVIYM